MHWTARLGSVTGVSKSPKQDVKLSLIILFFAGAIWWEAAKLPPPFFDPLGSAALPKAIASILLFLMLIMLVRAALAWPWQDENEATEFRPRPDLAIGIVALSVAYVGGMHLRLVSFEYGTILFLISSAALLGRMNRRTLLLGTAAALIMGFGATWLFTRFFFIDLPR
jgi:putative tricarboxylic transport membrane protein